MTNDDGIEAVGIHVLARAIADAGHEVVVAAPAFDASGWGAALGRLHPDTTVDCSRVEIPGLDAPAWAVDGPPGLCVLAANLLAFGERPDLVVSGVNIGLNTGRAILHSGTVGAALTAQNFGLSGLAVSVQSISAEFGTAAAFAVQLLPLLEGAPARSVLNLNVPGLPYDEVRGLRWARLAPFGEVRAAVASSEPLQFELRVSDVDFAPDTDEGLVRNGYAAVTALVAISEAWPDDSDAADPHLEAPRLMPGAPVEHTHPFPSVPRRPLHHSEPT